MDLPTKQTLIRLAMAEADKAIQEGNSPFGAVLCDQDGNVILAAHNSVNSDVDPTAHAEINLIRRAVSMLKTKKLNGYCLVSNVQSCPMCFSAAVRSGIRNFIYGYPEDETLVPKIDVFELRKYCKDEIEIETGILRDECEAQLKKFREQKTRV